jgi:hypothetical protein
MAASLDQSLQRKDFFKDENGAGQDISLQCQNNVS